MLGLMIPLMLKPTIMAFASGNVLHYLRLYDLHDDQGHRYLEGDVATRTLDSEILLIRCEDDCCVAVTQEYVHVINYRDNNMKSVLKQDNTIVDAAVWRNEGVLLVTTDLRLMFIGTRSSEIVDIDTGGMEIISVSVDSNSAYALSSELHLFDIERESDGHVSLSYMQSKPPATSDKFRLISDTWLWNEEIIYNTNTGEIITTADRLGSAIVCCEVAMSRLFILTEDGRIIDINTHKYTKTRYNKMCIARSRAGFVLLGVRDSGEASVIIGPKIQGLPVDVTVVSGELYIPNYRHVKSAAS